jgi:hypothetical protein
MRVVKKCLILR